MIGSPYHGRDVAGTEKLIGYLVNMLALRILVTRGGSIASTVRNARDVAANGMQHAALPFQQIVHELLPQRQHDASYSAEFQAMIGWGEQVEDGATSEQGLLGSDIEVQPFLSGAADAKTEISLDAVMEHGGMHGSISFNTDLYMCMSIERLASRWSVLAAALIPAPQSMSAWTLPLMPTDESEATLWLFNDILGTRGA